MQETPIDPTVKAELARCVAAHRALKSFAVDVRITTRGLPQPRGGTVQIALARPGRLRMEAQGPLRAQGTCLLVASNGFIYEASSPKKTYKVTALPIGSDPLEYGLRDDVLLPLPAFTEIMVLRDGLETLMQRLANLRMEREVVLGAPPLRVFH